MKCNTILCSREAKYKNLVSGEAKCKPCLSKRPDQFSHIWEEIKEESEFLNLPAAKRFIPYRICELTNGKYGVQKIETETISHVAHSEEEACAVCRELINAFKYGAETTLHNLNTFVLDQRRKNGIVWGDGRNDTNH
jgi:hypothetical protein